MSSRRTAWSLEHVRKRRLNALGINFLFVLLGAIVGVTAQPLSAAEPAAPPVVQKRLSPKYVPRRSLGDMWPGAVDREALVFLRVDVDAEGNATNVELADGGFHEKRFVDAAIKATRRMKFVPATVDGVPVSSTATLPFRFLIADGSKGVWPEFRAELDKVRVLVEEKDFAGAHFHAQWMLTEKVKLLYEYTLVNVALAVTSARAGDLFGALIASRDASARSGMVLEQYEPGGPLPKVQERDFLLDKVALAPMLRLRYTIGVVKGAYLDALHAGADAQALGLIKPDEALLADFSRVVALVQAADALRAEGRIDTEGKWLHEPALRNVALRDIKDGSIEGVRIACGNESVAQRFVPGQELKLPADATDCVLIFRGHQGPLSPSLSFAGPMSEGDAL